MVYVSAECLVNDYECLYFIEYIKTKNAKLSCKHIIKVYQLTAMAICDR